MVCDLHVQGRGKSNEVKTAKDKEEYADLKLKVVYKNSFEEE